MQFTEFTTRKSLQFLIIHARASITFEGRLDHGNRLQRDTSKYVGTLVNPMANNSLLQLKLLQFMAIK